MKIALDKIGQPVEGGLSSPNWLKQAEGFVKGVNQLFENYWALQGKPNPNKATEQAAPVATKPPTKSFSEAREEKKLEMANKQTNIPIPQTNEFRELLSGLIKTTKTLEAMGFADKPIGEVIQELPFTLKQSSEFLEKLYQSKYGG